MSALRTSARSSKVLVLAAAIAVAAPTSAFAASAEPASPTVVAPCSVTKVVDEFPTYGAMTTTNSSSATTTLRWSKRVSTSAHRSSGGWTARVSVKSSVTGVGLRPFSARIPTTVRSWVTVQCTTTGATMPGSASATGASNRTLRLVEVRRYVRTASATRSTRSSAVAAARQLAVVRARVDAREHACQAVSGLSTSSIRAAARADGTHRASLAARAAATQAAQTLALQTTD